MNVAAVSLNHWVLDEGKVVTSSYILRATDLNVVEVQKLLEEFIRKNSNNPSINASYCLVGTLKSDDDDIQRKKSVICRGVDLDETKKRFHSVDNCTIYSVQAKPLTDFNTVFNPSWLDSTVYLNPETNKTLVRNPIAVEYYAQWKKSHNGEEKRLEEASSRFAFEDKVKQSTKSSEVKNIDQLFAKSIAKTSLSLKKDESPQSGNSNNFGTMKKPLRLSDENASNVACEMDVSPRKRMKPANALISSDEEIGVVEDPTKPSSSSTSATGKKASEGLDNNMQDDIFCTGEDESSSEKWGSTTQEMADEKDSTEKKAKPDPIAAKKTKKSADSSSARGRKNSKKGSEKLIGVSSDDENNDDTMEIDNASLIPKMSLFKGAAGGGRTPAPLKRTEKITRTYTDEDGFEVTEVVTKEVDDDKKESPKAEDVSKAGEVRPKSASKAKPDVVSKAGEARPENANRAKPGGRSTSVVLKPANNSAASASSKSAKKAPATSGAQTKISSFFTKK